ncbi:unnamed protein product [Rhizophagus irregularis]|nr:unnamed protein product [Rhizophagus irregularis]
MQGIGNHEVDKFIQKTQLKAKNDNEVLEWIEYDRFENVEYLTKGGFGTIYKAIWKDGWIKCWDFENNKWTRSKTYCREYENFPVVLKCLHNSQDITSDFLREIEIHMILSEHIGDSIAWCHGITKDPESRNFMIVMGYVQNEPKNAIDNKDDDNSFGEYSESIEAVDFTKLDLDKSS